MSNKGFVLYAEGEQYIQQAYLCALSIKKFNQHIPVSLITNTDVANYKYIFDKIIPVPTYNGDNSRFKTYARQFIYELSPYEETISMDSDVLVLHNLDYFWQAMNTDVYYCDTVFTYRGEKIKDTFYRKAFISNNLPNVYNAFFYFKKSKYSKQFYTTQKHIADNWQEYYRIFCPKNMPKEPSMDIITAITHIVLDIRQKNNIMPNLVHMKPAIQNWEKYSDNWSTRVSVFVDDDANLKIGNHAQHTVFHYTDNSFVNEDIIRKFEDVQG